MRRLHVAISLVILSVALAGCTGMLGSESGPEFADEETESLFEDVLDELSDGDAEAFESAIIEDEEVTESGEELLERLHEVEALGDEHRDAVAASVAEEGSVTEDDLETIDRLLASPEAFAKNALATGLDDATHSGILDGEKAAFGLDPDEADPAFVELAQPLAANGYDELDVEYLTRIGELSDFEAAQAERVAPPAEQVADGAVSEADLEAITDDAGDGLLNAKVTELGLEPDDSNDELAAMAEPLADDGFDDTDVAYLERTAAMDEFEWEQLVLLDLHEEPVANGTVTEADLEAIDDDTGDGLLNAKATELELDPGKTHPEVVDMAELLSAGGFDDHDVFYLTRIGEMVDDEFQWSQAEYFGLLDEAVSDGELHGSEAWAVEDTGNGLLDITVEKFDVTEPDEAEVIAELGEPLAESGFDDTDIAYLSRVAELHAYEDHPYEGWAQAEELGLLHDVVEDGDVTDDDLWAIENDADNRLLNGMEEDFGTDPTLADTSGDGFEDHLKWGPMQDLGLEVTPDEPDVYVEVESDRFTSMPTASQQREIESLFAAEPATDHGPINVHFHEFRGNLDPASNPDEMDDRAADRSVDRLGFHYLLLTDGPYTDDGEELGGQAFASTQSRSWMVVVDSSNEQWQTATIAHEMGHALGIFAEDFDGVDSHEYSATEYNSVMNYNVQGEQNPELTFSTGDPFDDYAHMYDQEFGSFHTDASDLDAVWDAGEVPDQKFD